MSMQRTIRGWTVALLLGACGDGSGAAAADTTAADTTSSSGTPATSSSGDAECYAGYEKCPCMDGLCLDGLVCLSDLCVQPAIEGSSEDGESSTTVAAESSGDSSTAVDTGSSEESSTTVVPDGCLDDDNYCDDDTLQVCADGFWQYTSCSDWCAELGYLSPGCATADACLCDGFADEVCTVGAFNICVCAEADYDIPCTDEQMKEYYDQCWTMANTYVECFSTDEQITMYAQCAPLEMACL